MLLASAYGFSFIWNSGFYLFGCPVSVLGPCLAKNHILKSRLVKLCWSFFFNMLVLLRRTYFSGHLLSPVFQSSLHITIYFSKNESNFLIHPYNTHPWDFIRAGPLFIHGIHHIFVPKRDSIHRSRECFQLELGSECSTTKPPRLDTTKIMVFHGAGLHPGL